MELIFKLVAGFIIIVIIVIVFVRLSRFIGSGIYDFFRKLFKSGNR